MSTNELMVLDNKVTTILELEDAARELQRKADEIKDGIKELMSERGETEVVTFNHVIRFREVLQTRFDKNRFIADMGDDAYLFYTKQVASMRFNVD